MGQIDIIVVCVYLLFMFALGFVFKSKIKDTKDYFCGSGQMLWWMVGATAFMNQFSAWTFTGAIGAAYNNGFQIAVLFFADAVSFYLGYRFFAARMRRMRVITIMEAVRRRFGPINEQVFTWTQVPSRLLGAAVWLAGLGLIVSASTSIPVPTALIAAGVVVVLMSLFGGSWAVIASDFVQMLVVFCVTVTVFVVVMIKGGGPMEIISNFPAENFFFGDGINYKEIFFAWIVITFMKQVLPNNSIQGSYRYLVAKDCENARKGALIPICGYILGACIWFFPAWFAADKLPIVTLQTSFPQIKQVADISYLAVVKTFLPAGMIGLFVSAVFAATMSSMDTGLNSNTGVLIRSFYLPVIKKGRASESELLFVSKILTLVLGILIVLAALYMNSLRELSLFQIVMRIQSLVTLPIVIPLFFGVWIKKTPDWSGWGTLLVGAFVSYISGPLTTWLPVAMNLELTVRDAADLRVVLATSMHFVFTIAFFLISTFFYKESSLSSERKEVVNDFFKDLETPVVSEEADQEDVDQYQRKSLGMMVVAAACGILLLMFTPEQFGDKMIFALCSGLMFIPGLGLLYSARKIVK